MKSSQSTIQKLGSYLSGMVMPNIGALIAWGIITALFIPDGYFPNENIAALVGPMINYLIPLLIAFKGGEMVHGFRGGVVGTVATMGAIVGSGIPMLLGAMMLGPLGGYAIKKFDEAFGDKIPTGFEMLINNFSSGIIGFILAIFSLNIIGPVVEVINNFMAAGVDILMKANLLPLTNILIEPAKILFMNNALNHGILTPIGTQQASEMGKSVLYLLETNPGPGLGVLLAFALLGKGSAKSSSWGAMIIHFLGGIHEIYFPYVLMKPLMILAVIAGGVAGTFTNVLLGSGLRAPASPGSVIAILGMAPEGQHLNVLLGILAATVVSFIVAAIVLKMDKGVEVDLEAAQQQVQAAKSASKGQTSAPTSAVNAVATKEINRANIDNIIFACDAGMGSSAMGASLLRKKVKDAGIDIAVSNSPINSLKDNARTLIITQEELTERAKGMAPSSVHVSVDNFLSSPKYAEIIDQLK